MEKTLTVYEMVNYEIPKKYTIPISAVNSYKNGWRIPKFNPSKIFDSYQSISSLKPTYKDVSRERQCEFLKRSGKIIKKNTYASANKILASMISTPKSLPPTANPNKRRAYLSTDSNSRLNTCKILKKNCKNLFKSALPCNISTLLAKIRQSDAIKPEI